MAYTYRIDLLALTSAGPTQHKPVLDPLNVHHLENRQSIYLSFILSLYPSLSLAIFHFFHYNFVFNFHKFFCSQNHVASAQKAAEDAKKQASKANTELYKLNIGFKNVSVSLESKTESIGTAKDRAVDLQQRANALATSASNQLSNLLGLLLLI